MAKRTKPISAPVPPGPRIVGYARVSTEDQSLDLQVEALRRAGVMDENLWQEKRSAANKKRPALDMAIKDLRPGDTLAVWRLDRLARNMRDLYARLDQIYAADASFKSLTEHFDFGTATGKFILGILGLVAEFERQLIAARTKAGIETCREKTGRDWGRERSLTDKQVREAKAAVRKGSTIKQLALRLKVSETTLRNYGVHRRPDRVARADIRAMVKRHVPEVVTFVDAALKIPN